MKPFIKPKPTVPTTRAAAAAAPRVSPNELTIFGVASSIADTDERNAYLDRACTDPAQRVRIEERLSSRAPQTPPTPSAPPQSSELVRTSSEQALSNSHGRPDALALVPMSAMQFAAAQQPPRHSPIPWAAATLMAIAVGALAVFFWSERQAREAAERESLSAVTQRQEAEKARAAAAAAAETATVTVAEKDHALQEAEKAKEAVAKEAATARELAAKNQRERDQALATARSATEKAQAAQAEIAKLRSEAGTGQRDTALALADSLARLASFQFDARNYIEAENSARQSLQLRANAKADGWAILESRALLGSILLQKNQDAEAEQEFIAAGTAIETLGPPGNDIDRARVTAASKRIVQFFTITGRRKEANDWRRRLDAVLAAR